MTSTFFNKYFDSVKMSGQACYHLLYPSKSFNILKIIKEKNILKQLNYLRNMVTSNNMSNIKYLSLVARGSFVHNYIQDNPKIRKDYVSEYKFKFRYKCLLISGRIDLMAHNYRKIIEIKSTEKTPMRDYWLLQVLLYAYVISKIRDIPIEEIELKLLAISSYEVVEYNIQPSTTFVEDSLNKYIEAIHKIESCDVGESKILEYYEGFKK